MRLAVLFAVLLVAGCTHVQPLALSSPEGRAAVTERAATGHAELSLDGEPTRFVRDLVMDADSARWTDARTGRARTEPTSRVRAVSFTSYGRGAVRGATIGLGVGLAFGGLAAASEDNSPFFRYSVVQWLALGAAEGVVLGAGIGVLAGGRTSYRR